ncbi:MAG: VanZ family protein [Clostridiales bacterium]|nr:VanZ family protein [Clostridiales bacterium]
MPSISTMIILLFVIVVVSIIAIFVIAQIGVIRQWDTSTVVKFEMVALFAIYVVTLLVITIVARDVRDEQPVYLIPFGDLYFIIKNKYPWYVDDIIKLNILNAALFIPYGFLAREVFKGKILIPTVSSLLVSLIIEILQLITSRGVFDINDIIYNTIGSLIGCGLYTLYKILRRKVSKQE